MNRHRSWTWTAPADDWDKTPLPMRPSGDDLIFREAAIRDWAARNGPPRGLILGVTPQYDRLPWPEGSHVVAIDRSRPMIDAVWPGGRDRVVCGDWTSIPLQNCSRDLMLCDGGLSMLTYPEGLAMGAHDLARIVAPGGLAIFRLYVPPAAPITAEGVVRAARAGEIEASIELSILFWGALRDPATTAYKAGQSLDALEALGEDARALFAECGWNPDEVDNLEKLRDGDIWLYFPTVAQVAAAFAPAFALERVLVPSYRLGDRFPTAIFRRL